MGSGRGLLLGKGTYLRTGVLGRCSLLQVDRVLRLVRRGLQRLVLRRGAGEGESQEEGGGQHVDFGGRHAELCSVRRAGGSERERARERAEGTVRTEPPRVVGRRGASLLWSPPNARRLRLPANIELAPPPTPHAQSVTSCQLWRTRGGPRPPRLFPSHSLNISFITQASAVS